VGIHGFDAFMELCRLGISLLQEDRELGGAVRVADATTLRLVMRNISVSIVPQGMRGDRASTKDAALDWQIARANRFHVLVIGAADAVEQSLAALMPHLDPPVCCWTPDGLLPSPGDVKTLVIRNVEVLTAERQREVLSWLEQAAVARTRVVSTTTVPLFERVSAGLFLDTLYYRLNAVMLYGPDS
jgi:hypothetical protein